MRTTRLVLLVSCLALAVAASLHPVRATATAVAGGPSTPIYVFVLSATAGSGDDVHGHLDVSQVESALADLDAYLDMQTNGLEGVHLAGYERGSMADDACRPTGDLLRHSRYTAFGGRFGRRDPGPGTLLVLTPESTCSGPAGLGGGRSAITREGLAGPTATSVLTHEYLHTLGLLHANAGLCASPTRFDNPQTVFASGPCTSLEYGDTLDVMGNAYGAAVAPVSSFHRLMQGWLPPSAVAAPSAGTDLTVTLSDLVTGSGARVLAITDPRTSVPYTVEFRTRTVPEAEAEPWWRRGAGLTGPAPAGYRWSLTGDDRLGSVRVLRAWHWPCQRCSSVVLAAGREGGASGDPHDRHGWLSPGESFTAGSGAFTVDVLEASPAAGAVVRLRYASEPTVVTVSPVQRRIGPAHDVALGVDVRTAAGSPVRVGTVRILDGDDRVVATAALPQAVRVSGLALGRQSLRAEVLPGPTHQGAISAPVTVRVARWSSRTHLTVPRRTARKVSLNVRVATGHRRKIAGRVVVRDRGTVVARGWASGRRSVRVRLSVPVVDLRPGSVLRARFLGSATVSASTSRAVRVRR